MREILFKARNKDGTGWEEGVILPQAGGDAGEPACLYTEEGIRVACKPGTACQYSGYRDQNGNRIWEGDIIIFSMRGTEARGIVRYGEYANPFGNGKHVGFYVEWQGNKGRRKETWMQTDA